MNMFSRQVLGVTLLPLFMACGARADVSAAWNQDSDGNWSQGSNWSGGNPAAGATGVATFANLITASRTITIDSSPWTINQLIFGGAGGYSWTIAGGILNLSGSTPSVTVNHSATIASTLSGSSGLTKAGSGTLILSGANTYSGGTTISGGTVQIGDGTGTSATAGTGLLSVGNATLELNFNGPVTLANSAVTGNYSIRNIGTGKVTLNNGAIGGTIDGGEAGIALANLITGDFLAEGDLAFGSGSRDYTIQVKEPGATLRIINQGTFWWVGGRDELTGPNLDIAAGVTVSLSPYQAKAISFTTI
ncbi:MAG: autotransporter-associated beta strand repeat-containing protein [Kiritimatiellae bacterium]|nr:autotransporter-associated beta strand repeat-containing protein [Kiritimatiellia bacterium]